MFVMTFEDTGIVLEHGSKEHRFQKSPRQGLYFFQVV